jgi:tripartite ATP-independent transporter DctP family solute receptor
MKNTISRRTVLAGGIAAAVLPWVGARPARAAEFVLKYGNDTPPTHPMNVRMREAAKRIAADSNGRVELQIFANNTLGGDSDMLSQLRFGALQMMTLSGNVLSTLVPVTSITGMAFSFADYQAVWAAVDGELGAMIRAAIGGVGLVAMDKCWDNGFRQITSSTRPIGTPDDLNGFKIRIPVSPVWTSTFRTLGALPISLNSSEMYSALQTHVADGQENSLPIIDTYKLYEVQKYCSLTNHMWEGFWMLVNGASWNKLPPDLRAVVAKHLNAAALAERDDIAQRNAVLQKQLEGKGLIFNSVHEPAFKAKLRAAGYYDQWAKTFGAPAWAVFEKAVGGLN